MIDIILTRAGDNGVKLEISGHAEVVKTGIDPVCAAVSTLAQTLAARIGELGLKTPPKTVLANGKCLIEAYGESTDGRLAEAVNTVESGFRLISESFPGNVRFTARLKID